MAVLNVREINSHVWINYHDVKILIISVNGMLKWEDCLDFSKTFRIFVL